MNSSATKDSARPSFPRRLSRLRRATVAVACVGLALPAAALSPAPVAAQSRATPCGDAPAGYNVIVSDELRIDGTRGNDFICGGDGPNNIRGGRGNDIIHGGLGADVVRGGPGNDIIRGGNGDDRLMGQRGHDVVEGDNGDDYLRGGAGRDEVDGSYGSDIVNGGDGDDQVQGGPGNDIVMGAAGNDAVSGGVSQGFGDLGDIVFGDYANPTELDGSDVLQGGDGDDLFDAGGGDDVIIGVFGDDRMSGRAGNDYLDGGPGRDAAVGGAGTDTCVVEEATDCGPAETLQAEQVLANVTACASEGSPGVFQSGAGPLWAVDREGESIAVGSLGSIRGITGRVCLLTQNDAGAYDREEVLRGDQRNANSFGRQVQLEGGRLLVPNHGRGSDQGTFDGGVSQLFERNSSGALEATPLNQRNNRDLFGFSMDIDGELIAAGAPGRFDLTSPQAAGSVHLLEPNGSGEWRTRQTVQASDAMPDDRFGKFVSLEGSTLAIGSDRSVYVFEISANGEARQVSRFRFPRFAVRGLSLEQGRLVVIVDNAAVEASATARIYERNAQGRWARTASLAMYGRFGSFAFTGDTLVYSGSNAATGATELTSRTLEVHARASRGRWSRTDVQPDFSVGEIEAVALDGSTLVVGTGPTVRQRLLPSDVRIYDLG